MDTQEVERLARLARIELSAEEIKRFPEQLEAILGYVGRVNALVSKAEVKKEVGVRFNVFREDVVTNEPGSYTKKILEEMPQREGDFLKVKKILNND